MKHILIVFHRNATLIAIRSSVICRFARIWRSMGYRVTFQCGIDRLPTADLVFLHVDLSVVPDEYIEFAARYPVSVNGRVRDIRKSTISDNLVFPGDDWTGPVIAKSDLNYAGKPEYILTYGNSIRKNTASRYFHYIRNWVGGRRDNPRFKSWRDYRIFDSLGEVPGEIVNDPEIVLERFLPDLHDGIYTAYAYQFLGHASVTRRITSTHPVVKGESSSKVVFVEPNPEAEAWRRQFRLDYGKIDYVIHNGKPILLDVNKTTGQHPSFTRDVGADKAEIFGERARAIASFFPDGP